MAKGRHSTGRHRFWGVVALNFPLDLPLVSCPVVLSTYSFASHCLKQFCESSQLSCYFTAHVVLVVDYSFKSVMLKPWPARPSGAAREAIFIGKKT